MNIGNLLTDKHIESYPNFEGYRLSNNSPQIYQLPLKNGIIEALPNNDQYSYLHMKFFSCHNHLFIDNWTNPKNVFFIDNLNKVFTLNLSNISDEGLIELNEIWQVPIYQERQNGHYNPSMVFISNDYIALSDGCGNLHLIETENRNDPKNTIWKCSETFDLQYSFSLLTGIKSESNQIHLIALRIDEKERTNDKDPSTSSSSSFCSILEWITFEKEISWKKTLKKEMEIYGPVYSAYIDKNDYSLYVVAEGEVKFLWTDLQQQQTKNIKYYWWQTDDNISIQVPLYDDIPKKNDININITNQELNVNVKNSLILNGKLTNRIDSSLTTWTIENKNLTIVLTKNTPVSWPNVLPESSGHSEYLIDPSLAEQIHQQLAHLTSDTIDTKDTSGVLIGGNDELEECDEPSKSIFRFIRIELFNENKITHQINLTGHQWIYGNIEYENQNQNICLRHLDDGYIWSSHGLDQSLTWSCKQRMIFPALGYIHAGKPKRKFIVVSPDLMVTCIAEHNGQLYIYYHPNAILNDRINNSKTFSKHQVFNINEEIYGIYIDNHYGFVLTPTKIMAFILY